MWLLITPEEEESKRKAMEDQFRRMHDENTRKAEALRDWLAASTCKHCGQHPQIPPWFAGVSPAEQPKEPK
jgi:hypothetical protein